METEYINTEQFTFVSDVNPNYAITFRNKDGLIGTLDFNGPAMKFEGEAEESAKIFFGYISEMFEKRSEEHTSELQSH